MAKKDTQHDCRYNGKGRPEPDRVVEVCVCVCVWWWWWWWWWCGCATQLSEQHCLTLSTLHSSDTSIKLSCEISSANLRTLGLTTGASCGAGAAASHTREGRGHTARGEHRHNEGVSDGTNKTKGGCCHGQHDGSGASDECSQQLDTSTRIVVSGLVGGVGDLRRRKVQGEDTHKTHDKS
jgi:hypothetical protein